MDAPSIAIHTLGCKLNYAEGSTLYRMLEEDGYSRRSIKDQADIYILNTCSVTDNAEKECRQLVRRIRRRAPACLVVITGCYAQLRPEELASIPGVDLVLGGGAKFEIPRYLKELSRASPGRICSCEPGDLNTFHSAYSLQDRTRSFLKVQDGCDYHCTFCTIPAARGASRSDRIAHVIDQAAHLGDQGIQEIVLSGVNLGDFGSSSRTDGYRKEGLLDLIQALDQVPGVSRYRISSIEPNLLSPEIIRFVAGSQRFMPHFHIPLQSGSDRILGLMRRRYRRELYRERVSQIRELMPDAGIGADIIVGFPSESPEDFELTRSFLEDLDISYLHVFTYSERPGTTALEIRPSVPVQDRNERNRKLRILSLRKMEAFISRQAGTTRPVLFEAPVREGLMEGYTDNYIRVQTNFRPQWENRIVNWVL